MGGVIFICCIVNKLYYFTLNVTLTSEVIFSCPAEMLLEISVDFRDCIPTDSALLNEIGVSYPLFSQYETTDRISSPSSSVNSSALILASFMASNLTSDFFFSILSISQFGP
ncbi:MAG: hypothetical protein QM532_00245 [Cyanobium sp. MAG06]|nr:hypothetical protein [Cyanobium sp. MAG06]